MSTIPAAPGAQDWLPDRMSLRREVIGDAERIFEAAGYRQMDVPVFEDIALFGRTAGEGSDVVTKEMYEFRDKGDRHVALRPEFTAGLVRSYLQHGLSQLPQPFKVYAHGTAYRYNRMQRGRYREFVQFDAEILGSSDPACDAELIALAAAWFDRLGLERIELRINSIDTPSGRAAYVALLRAYLEAFRADLSEDVRRLLVVNPLRVFDTKDPASREILSDAPKITDHLSSEAETFFARVREFLDARGVSYVIDPMLVRGLDYYTHTAWEFISPDLGAQSTICGGGRYDGLAEAIGGARTPGVGFAAGVDRMLLLLGEGLPAPAAPVYVLVAEGSAAPRVHAIAERLRLSGIATEVDLGGRTAKGQDKRAASARIVVRCDGAGADAGVCSVRDRGTGVTEDVELDRLVTVLRERLGI